MKKLILLTIFTFFILLSQSGSTYAYNLVKRSDLGLDESIADQSQKIVRFPSKIVVSRIFTSNTDYEDDPQLWFSSLYYYTVTRLGYLDIPYNFVIDRDGKVYEGRSGGIYTDAETSDQVGTIVIGYLSNLDDITPRANQSLQQLIKETSYTYGVERKDVSVLKLFIKRNENGLAKSAFENDTTTFSRNTKSILDKLAYSSTEHLKYVSQVKDVVYTNNVRSTDKFTVDATIINKNDFPWFTAKDYIYLSTKGSKESTFAVNGKWESFSKPLAISSRVIMPGEEVKLSFDMQAMLIPGKYTEKFELMKLPKTVFTGSEFSVNFKIEKGNFKLVKIVNIPALNVRSCIGPNCDIITQVGENQIFIMLEKNAGWYKIKYTDKKTGWVFGQYVQEL